MNDNDIVRRTDIINRLLDRAKPLRGLIHVNEVIRIINVAPSVNPPEREVLDKIRAEIEQAADKQFQIAIGIADLNERYTHIQMENAYRHSLNIIDKYKAEVEPQESEEV